MAYRTLSQTIPPIQEIATTPVAASGIPSEALITVDFPFLVTVIVQTVAQANGDNPVQKRDSNALFINKSGQVTSNCSESRSMFHKFQFLAIAREVF